MNKNRKIISTIFSIFFLGVFSLSFSLPVLAAPDFGINYAASIDLTDEDPREMAAIIVKIALGFLGIIAVIIILLGGFKWMTAGGNEEKTGEARKLIVAGIIGLVIIFSAWAIASFVINSLSNIT